MRLNPKFVKIRVQKVELTRPEFCENILGSTSSTRNVKTICVDTAQQNFGGNLGLIQHKPILNMVVANKIC